MKPLQPELAPPLLPNSPRRSPSSKTAAESKLSVPPPLPEPPPPPRFAPSPCRASAAASPREYPRHADIASCGPSPAPLNDVFQFLRQIRIQSHRRDRRAIQDR